MPVAAGSHAARKLFAVPAGRFIALATRGVPPCTCFVGYEKRSSIQKLVRPSKPTRLAGGLGEKVPLDRLSATLQPEWRFPRSDHQPVIRLGYPYSVVPFTRS